MNIRCPCCGAVSSLDVLVADLDAADTLKVILAMGELGRAAVSYAGLFRPAKSQLGWPRLNRLLRELLPDMQAQSISRDGVSYPAPPEAWLHGFAETLAARDAGRLKAPLKSHGYLYEVLAGWQPPAVARPADCGLEAVKRSPPPSATLQAAAVLEGRRRARNG